jgi:3-oxoacyl-(acyl-carrier-protein) synthase
MINKQKIYLTAMSAISAIGDQADDHFESIKKEKTGIGEVDFLQTKHRQNFLFGEVKKSNSNLIKELELSSGYYSRTSLLGLFACKQLLETAKLSPDLRTGFISATTVGGMDQSEHYLQNYLKGEFLDFAKEHPLGSSTEFIANQLNFKGYRTTLSTACSSSANAIILGSRLIQSGMLDRVVVGGVDVLSAFTLNGFNSLMILDPQLCKPFDAERKGLNLGEAAAYLLMENQQSMEQGKRTAIATLSGYANTNDAFHQTASSPDGDGAFAAMSGALLSAKLNPQDISYINAHGTGTPNNDLSEGIAIQRLMANTSIPFSSTKAFTGHTLGAAAAIEAVISLLCIQNQYLPLSLNFYNQMPELNINPIKQSIETNIVKHVISNSFGFGGNNSSLIFSKPE